MKPENLTKGDIINTVLNYVWCGLIVIGIYTVSMITLFMFIRKLFFNNEVTTTWFGNYFWFVLYALAYMIPLYFIHFRRNNTYKHYILKITETEFNIRNIFSEFTLFAGKYDILIYAVYSLVMLLPKGPNSPVEWLAVQECVFYTIPVPSVISYILSVITFVIQYYICLLLISKHWNRNRIRKITENQEKTYDKT